MATGRLKARLGQQALACGSWIAVADLFSVEAMGLAGFDWVLIDLEHCPIDLSELKAMIPILEATGTSTVVRVPDRGDYWIKQALDLGADGVMVPRVDSAELARQAVSYAKYAPLGERGFGPVRATRYGHAPDYPKTANQETFLLVQLEHRLALQNLDGILEVEGVDGYFIGAADLGQSLGKLGELGAPELQQAVRALIQSLNGHGKIWGAVSHDAEMFRSFAELGGRLLTLGGDLAFLKQGAEECLRTMRRLAAERVGGPARREPAR